MEFEPVLILSNLFIVVIAILFFWRFNFFRLEETNYNPQVGFLQTAGMFLTYFMIQTLLFPLSVFAFYYLIWDIPVEDSIRMLQHQASAWVIISGLLILYSGTLGAFYLFPDRLRRSILSENQSESAFKIIGFGLGYLLLIYPLVGSMNILLSSVVQWVFQQDLTLFEQTAMTFVKDALKNPLAMGVSSFLIIIGAPIVEELLFRGLLQNWFKSYFSTWTSIALSALSFALIHYASSQGLRNIELLVSIFILGIALGFVYEKKQSLLAPIALHTGFNAIGILTVFFGNS